MDQETFMQSAKENLGKNVEEVTLKVLAKMLNENVCYFDMHYIRDRSLEIIERTVDKLKFNSKVIEKARRAFLDVLLDGAQVQLYGFEDDYKLAKTLVRDKDTKKEAKEVLSRIERMRANVPADLTETRDMECEPICQMIASDILSSKTMLKDDKFVNDCIEMDNKFLISTLYRFYFEGLIDQLITSLDKSYINANEKHWGCRRDQIRMKAIDNRLKEV